MALYSLAVTSIAPSATEASVSMRIVNAFVTVLRDDPRIPAAFLDLLQTSDPDARLPYRVVLQVLQAAEQLTGCAELGVLAARTPNVGDFHVIEYAVMSCPTAGESFEALLRYIRLMNDAVELTLEIHGPRAHLIARSTVPISRVAADFKVFAVAAVIERWLGRQRVGDAEVWRAAPAPEVGSEYHQLTSVEPIRWSAPYDALVFDSAILSEELPNADPKLHAVLRAHADQLLSKLPQAMSFTEQTRGKIVELLPSGAASADSVAGAFGMNRRTLSRRLDQEQTSFSAVLQDVRQGLAERYLVTTSLPLEEIGFLVGFSGSGAFSRAFKRWTGKAPQEYRRTQPAG